MCVRVCVEGEGVGEGEGGGDALDGRGDAKGLELGLDDWMWKLG